MRRIASALASERGERRVARDVGAPPSSVSPKKPSTTVVAQYTTMGGGPDVSAVGKVVRRSGAPSRPRVDHALDPRPRAQLRTTSSGAPAGQAGSSAAFNAAAFVGHCAYMWVSGFLAACALHRVVGYLWRSRKLTIVAARCVVLNGAVFLGSLAVVERLLAPALKTYAALVRRRWEGASSASADVGAAETRVEEGDGDEDAYVWAGAVASEYFVLACHVLWLYPTYVVSTVVNAVWYGDIAKTTWGLVQDGDQQRREGKIPEGRLGRGVGGAEDGAKGTATNASTAAAKEKSDGGGAGLFRDIAANVYRVILVSVFFGQVSAVTLVFPGRVGMVARAVLETWLYAFYCFDYRWSMEARELKWRLRHFEGNWAYFSGFGSPCVLLSVAMSRQFDSSPFWAAGVMAMAFPLCMMTAMGAAGMGEEAAKTETRQRRIPIFRLANDMTLFLLRTMGLRR